MTRVNLGSGKRLKKGWINVDLIVPPKPDPLFLQKDIRKIKEVFPPNSLKEVSAHHVLEHMSKKDAETLIQDVYLLLEEEGTFTVEVPDLYECCKRFVELVEEGDFKQAYTSPINGLYGEVNPEHEGDYHRYGWIKERLISLLEATGFTIKMVKEGKVSWRDIRVIAIK